MIRRDPAGRPDPDREVRSGPGRPPLAVLDDVGKAFDGVWAVRHLDLTIEAGSITALIGPSGAGKTTAIGLLLGGYAADEGRAELLGIPAHRAGSVQRRALGYLPQQPVLYDGLTVEANLAFLASLWRVRAGARAVDEVLSLVELGADRRKRVAVISGGMRRRLSLAGCLITDPQLLVLDEPTAGLDPILRQRFWEYFGHLAEEGRALVIATQHVADAANCDVVGLIDRGSLPHCEAPAALRRRAYGGERILVEFERRPADDLLDVLAAAITGWVASERRGDTSVELVVADAGQAVPALTAAAAEHDLIVRAVDEIPIDWDDVFVRLVGSHREDDGPGDRITERVADRIADAIGSADGAGCRDAGA